MRRPIRVASAAALLAVLGHAAFGQTGVLDGNVSADSLGKHQLVGAEVSIPALQLTTRTNFSGDYRFMRVAAGRHVVVVTMAGFKSVGDSVTVVANGVTDHDFVMLARAIVLDSVVATAASPVRKYISPALNGFEERSKQGFGYFIVDTTLRRNDSERLSEVILQRVPGLALVQGPGAALYLASGRKQAGGLALSAPKAVMSCWVTVYIDGALVYNYTMDDAAPKSLVPPNRPDFSRLGVNQYAGVEFYAGASTFPAWVSPTNNDCGVLLLWTREK